MTTNELRGTGHSRRDRLPRRRSRRPAAPPASPLIDWDKIKIEIDARPQVSPEPGMRILELAAI